MADLAARLIKRLADANRDRNLVFSPISIYAVLALLAAGAGGKTLEEILGVLGARSRLELEDSVARLLDGSSNPDGGGPSVAFACGVWSDLTRPLKPAFRDAVVGKYNAEARSVDFRNDPEQAVQQIDAWAAAATGNLIQSAVPPGAVHRGTDLVLANAIYFRGKWDLPFYESSTKNRPFYRLDGTAVDVPFMSNYDRHFIAEHDGFKVLQLHYKRSSWYPRSQNHGMSMCIFLPDARDGLASLLDKITSASPAGFLREHLPKRTVSVGEFWVPKFELSFQSNLVGVLNDLGLRLPFTQDADLSEMLQEQDGSGSGLPFLVQDVFQKAVIQVNEEGTKAAAVTMSCFWNPSAAPPILQRQVDFVADHPFAYFIVEEASHAVLFAGHVVDPGNGAAAAIPSPAPFQERATTKREPENEVMNEHTGYAPVYYVPKPVSPVCDPVSPVYNPTSPIQPCSLQSATAGVQASPPECKNLSPCSPEEAATGEEEVPSEKTDCTARLDYLSDLKQGFQLFVSDRTISDQVAAGNQAIIYAPVTAKAIRKAFRQAMPREQTSIFLLCQLGRSLSDLPDHSFLPSLISSVSLLYKLPQLRELENDHIGRV
ncbi:putative serpin-Z8 [Triticum urartu]|uniref:putative serpin-Z8 n=1 Tax=Triticum urartu TaxID=4572 RepID=UPI002044B314|nr:putative serpin-Z8 [Triticum urartu]